MGWITLPLPMVRNSARSWAETHPGRLQSQTWGRCWAVSGYLVLLPPGTEKPEAARTRGKKVVVSKGLSPSWECWTDKETTQLGFLVDSKYICSLKKFKCLKDNGNFTEIENFRIFYKGLWVQPNIFKGKVVRGSRNRRKRIKRNPR